MLKRIDWSMVFVLFFCLAYGLGANIQSRMFPAKGSMAYDVRKMIYHEIKRLNDRHHCESQAIILHRQGSGSIVIWYEENEEKYWCGLLDPDKLTGERLKELAPHIEVLNSDRSIRRLVERESNKHSSR